MLPFYKATTLIKTGKCLLYKRKLSQYDIVFGAVYDANRAHWSALFIDIQKRQFFYIDPLGSPKEEQDSVFNNWQAYVSSRPDLAKLNMPFECMLVEHPLQIDNYNCGPMTLKFLFMLAQGKKITRYAFGTNDQEAQQEINRFLSTIEA